jgi:hypothetical protein
MTVPAVLVRMVRLAIAIHSSQSGRVPIPL